MARISGFSLGGRRVTEEAPKTLGQDGLFKLSTWNSLAITRLFGLPEIQGEPIQQEYEFPMQRRVDRLYRLADGSLLNIEHQSSLRDKDALARRMITYHMMIKEQFPDPPLLQIVVYTGREPADWTRIGEALEYQTLDRSGAHGIRFSAALRDFRVAPINEFQKSGFVDDLILGLMAAGGDDERYIVDVIDRIRQSRGAARRDAIEKFIAVCATMPDRKAGQLDFGDRNMWIEDVKDSPLVQQIIEIAGKSRLEAAVRQGREEGRDEGRDEGQRLGLATAIVRHANRRQIDLPFSNEETVNLLMSRTDQNALLDMIEAMPEMTEFNAFVKRFGVTIAAGDD